MPGFKEQEAFPESGKLCGMMNVAESQGCNSKEKNATKVTNKILLSSEWLRK